MSVLFVFSATSCQNRTHSNSIDPESFKPDTTYEILVYWDYLMPCLHDQLNKEEFKSMKSCPLCGKKSENLVWINYRSPDSTWEMSCGAQGPLSICPYCKIQVEYIKYLVN